MEASRQCMDVDCEEGNGKALAGVVVVHCAATRDAPSSFTENCLRQGAQLKICRYKTCVGGDVNNVIVVTEADVGASRIPVPHSGSISPTIQTIAHIMDLHRAHVAGVGYATRGKRRFGILKPRRVKVSLAPIGRRHHGASESHKKRKKLQAVLVGASWSTEGPNEDY
jgi:hypothetical protein